TDPAPDLARQLKRFTNVLSVVQNEGAEKAPIDKLIFEGASPSMLRQLDPHTQFFDPAQFQQLKQMQELGWVEKRRVRIKLPQHRRNRALEDQFIDGGLFRPFVLDNRQNVCESFELPGQI